LLEAKARLALVVNHSLEHSKTLKKRALWEVVKA